MVIHWSTPKTIAAWGQGRVSELAKVLALAVAAVVVGQGRNLLGLVPLIVVVVVATPSLEQRKGDPGVLPELNFKVVVVVGGCRILLIVKSAHQRLVARRGHLLV